MVTRLRQAQQKNKRKELNGMKLRENVDYRLDHEKKILYINRRIKDDCYRSNTEANLFVWEWMKQGYKVIHGCSDHFIKTGERN